MTPTQQPNLAADMQDRQAAQEILVELMRAGKNQCWSRAILERRLTHIDPLTFSDALARLQQRGILRLDGETITPLGIAERRRKADALAAVVLHDLVGATPQPVSVEEIARKCDRDPSRPDERDEVELALQWLHADGLASSCPGNWRASRPAIRAQQLSF